MSGFAFFLLVLVAAASLVPIQTENAKLPKLPKLPRLLHVPFESFLTCFLFLFFFFVVFEFLSLTDRDVPHDRLRCRRGWWVGSRVLWNSRICVTMAMFFVCLEDTLQIFSFCLSLFVLPLFAMF